MRVFFRELNKKKHIRDRPQHSSKPTSLLKAQAHPPPPEHAPELYAMHVAAAVEDLGRSRRCWFKGRVTCHQNSVKGLPPLWRSISEAHLTMRRPKQE